MRRSGAECPASHLRCIPELLTAAKTEGELTVYGSMNEAEALPFWKSFQDATGVQVNYVRSSDTQIMARVAIENRVRQRTWDSRSPPPCRVPARVPGAVRPAGGRGPDGRRAPADRRWYGVYANYNAPAYNTKIVKKADLPKTYDEFPAHKEWSGKIAIVGTDTEWLAAMFSYYGEERARTLVKSIAARSIRCSPTAIWRWRARSVPANTGSRSTIFCRSTVNVKMSGGADR